MTPAHPTPSLPGQEPRWAFLVNPVSGAGRGRHLLQALPGTLRDLPLPPERWTLRETRPGDLAGQVAELLEGHQRLVVAGGDGTIAAALDGVLRSQRPETPVGCLPLGTGNDLARELRLFELFSRQGLAGTLAAFLEERQAPFDLWSVNGRATLSNYLSVGFDAWAARDFATRRNLSPRRAGVLRNKLDFAASGFASLRRRLPSPCLLRLHRGGEVHEERLDGDRTLVALNISHYAAGLLRADHTRPDDGELSVTVVPTLHHYLGLLATRSLPQAQRLFRRRSMPWWKASRLELSWEGENAVQVDGEARDDLAAEGRLEVAHAGRVRVLTGPPSGTGGGAWRP